MKSRWKSGNRARLLENGEEFFPAVFDAIRSARTEVIIETFILFEDKVGFELQFRSEFADLRVSREPAAPYAPQDQRANTRVKAPAMAPMRRVMRKHRRVDAVQGRAGRRVGGAG